MAESTSGGIVSSCLLSYPNASSYFVGGAVLYSYPIRTSLLRFDKAEHEAMGGCPTEIIKRLAGALQEKTATTWGIGEGGAAGPTPSHNGHPPGFTAFAVMGPLECVATMETGSNDRIANMAAFATGLLKLFLITLRKHHRIEIWS